ncbi:MAG TPA: diheme cytochrome c-553 [Cyclobacteriaceae bacterium]|nr:diheme cytochrome c-553 [Cyclobacteriaceae bacterium]
MKSLGAIATVLVVGLASCSQPSEQKTVQKELSKAELIKKGKYIVTTSACHDCHSPKIFSERGMELDTNRLLSGHPKDEVLPPTPGNGAQSGWTLFSAGLTASQGPWGMTYSANLTPHETGIGNWTFDQFKTAIRKGKYKGLESSRDLLPPMPWQMYQNFTDDDLLAVFTYLKSLKPIDNLVPYPVSPDKLTSHK